MLSLGKLNMETVIMGNNDATGRCDFHPVGCQGCSNSIHPAPQQQANVLYTHYRAIVLTVTGCQRAQMRGCSDTTRRTTAFPKFTIRLEWTIVVAVDTFQRSPDNIKSQL